MNTLLNTLKSLGGFFIASFLWLGAAFAGNAINIDSSGLALQGYDPVAYFTEAKPVAGSSDFTFEHEGATYRFASAEHRDLFSANPD